MDASLRLLNQRSPRGDLAGPEGGVGAASPRLLPPAERSRGLQVHAQSGMGPLHCLDAKPDSLGLRHGCHAAREPVFQVGHQDAANAWLVERWVPDLQDRKSTRLNSSHLVISYAVFCLKKKKKNRNDSQATIIR